MKWTTTDPRTAGLADTKGAVINYVSGGTQVTLVKVGTGATDWAEVSAVLPAAPMDASRCPTTSTDPRTAGRAGAVDEVVLYYAAGVGTYLIKYGTGDTDWVSMPDLASASVSLPIAESDVANLVADLAAKVPATRTLNATSPLRIDGGASADLSADRTLSVTFPSIDVGLWSVVPDGTATYDGTTTILGVVPTTITNRYFTSLGYTKAYTLVRDVFFDTCTVNSTVRIICNGFRFFARTLVCNGLIDQNGDDGSTNGTGGTSAGAQTGNVCGGGSTGGAPSGTGANGSTNAGAAASAFYAIDNTTNNGSTSGGNGGVGPKGRGGGGGGVAVPALGGGGAGGSGGRITNTLTEDSGGPDIYALLRGGRNIAGSKWMWGTGGGGGAQDTPAGGSGNGGGGGGGGGLLLVATRTLSGTGIISADGGQGGNGTVLVVQSPGQAYGGGGGGGGGCAVVIYGTRSGVTIRADGGAGGIGASAGTATAGNGGAGGVGVTILCNVSGDGT